MNVNYVKLILKVENLFLNLLLAEYDISKFA